MDVIKRIVGPVIEDSLLLRVMRDMLSVDQGEGKKEKKGDPLDKFFKNYKVILGVDRLDYTKGVPLRLEAIDAFFNK